MIAMSFKAFIIKVLFFILSNLLPFKDEGRHPTTDVPTIIVSYLDNTIKQICNIF